MYKHGIIFLMMFVSIPGTASAAQLYLKDGGAIECLLARQQEKTVYVLVNRFTEVELDNNQVNIRKTFKGKKTVGAYHRLRKIHRHSR